MEQNNDARVIYFSDLLFSVLHAWRKILIVALIFALLLGGVQTLRFVKAKNAPATEISEETLEEISKVEAKIATNQKNITAMEEYLKQSTAINLNPYKIYQASADIYVEAETPEIAAAVLLVYRSVLNDPNIVRAAAQTLGIHTDYVSELINCNIEIVESNLLTLVVSYETSEGVDLLMADLLAGLEQAEAQIQQDVAPHTVQTIAHTTYVKFSQTLQKRQAEYATALETLKTECTTLEKDLKKLNTQTPSQTPTNPVVAAIAGAILGAVIVAGCVLIGHLASDKVYSARTLKNRSALRVLGRMPAGKCCKIDKWLCKMEKRACEPALAATAVNIQNYCQGAKHLLVAGGSNEHVEALLQILKEQNGLQISCCGSLLQDVAALQALPVCDTVLLVETCHKSTYADIDSSVQLVEDQGKALIGCLLLGG